MNKKADYSQLNLRIITFYALIFIAFLSQCLVCADEQSVNQAKALSKAFRFAAGKVLPAVVQIKGSEDFDAVGIGSGVVIDKKGVVMTNEHVTLGEKTMFVQLADGRVFPVKKVATDTFTDLAVLTIEPDEPIPFARLGDSDVLEIGDWVLAIGAPFSLDQSVSSGIISAKGRSIPSMQRAEMLQTDAAVNPGNSGGPLINLDGEVVGITTAIFSQKGTFEGISFAIPSNMVRWVSQQLLAHGKVSRTFLGITTAPVSAQEVKQHGLPLRPAVRVSQILDDGPAASSKLRLKDIILEFNRQPVRSSSELQRLVEQSQSGTTGRLTVFRPGLKSANPVGYIDVQLQTMPEKITKMVKPAIEATDEEDIQMFESEALGFSAVDLHIQLARQLNTLPRSGIYIMDVTAGTAAHLSGLRKGMIIDSCDARPIKTVTDFITCLETRDAKKPMDLNIRIGGQSRKVTLR